MFIMAEMEKNEEKPISDDEANEMVKNLRCEKYVKCSAMLNQNVKKVFDESIRSVLFGKKKKPPCIIL